MKVYGITGRSGCGKSSVTSVIRKHGHPFADGDELSRSILLPGSPILPLLQKTFGEDILDSDGTLKRRLLADRAFATPEGTDALTRITHPEIMRRLKNSLRQAEESGSRLFFIDGAVIIGTPFEPLCDDLILVAAPYETSVQRICARDSISAEMARRRLDAQPPEEFLRTKCRYILENNDTLDAIQFKTEQLLQKLEQNAGLQQKSK